MEVEEPGLLEVDGVAAGREDVEPRVTQERAHHERGLDARRVLVADHDERRRAEAAEPRLELRDGLPLRHHLAGEMGAGLGVVLARVAEEVREAAGILLPERRARGQALEAPEQRADSLAIEGLGGRRLRL